MAKTKNFKDLNLSNAFLFAVAMQDEETCNRIMSYFFALSIRSDISYIVTHTRCVVRKLVNHWKTEPTGYS